MKTRIDTLPIELKLQIYDMAKPQCICCNQQFANNNTYGYILRTDKPCECQLCQECLLESLWRHTGCDTPGECDSFACQGCQVTIQVEIIDTTPA